MIELLSSPNSAEALVIIRTLGDPLVAPDLEDMYGSKSVHDTQDVALGWMTAILRNRLPAAYPAEAYAPDLPPDLETTLTVAQEQTLDTMGVLFDFPEPEAFNEQQSAIVLRGVRRRARTARLLGARCECLRFLCEQAPSLDERVLSRMALNSLAHRQSRQVY